MVDHAAAQRLDISLGELDRFHGAYLTGAEGERRLGRKLGTFRRLMTRLGYSPVAAAHKMLVWRRHDGERALSVIMNETSGALSRAA